MLAPNGLDEDLRTLAKEAKFLFPSSTQNVGGAMAAGKVNLLPVAARLPFIVYSEFWQTLLSSPNVIRYLAYGLKQNGVVKRSTQATMRSLMENGSLDARPDEGGDLADIGN